MIIWQKKRSVSLASRRARDNSATTKDSYWLIQPYQLSYNTGRIHIKRLVLRPGNIGQGRDLRGGSPTDVVEVGVII